MKTLAYINKEFTIRIVKDIDDTEYEHLRSQIIKADRIQLLHMSTYSLTENFKAIYNLLENYSKGQITPMALKHLMVVQIQNFLSAVRGYVDTFAHTLSSVYGKDSPIFVEFENEKTKTYDNNASYRLVEVLRNFVQHRSFPNCNFVFKLTENGERKTELIMSKADFLSDPKIKGPKKKMIEEDFDENIDLLSHLKTMYGNLLLIHDKMMDISFENENLEEYFEIEKAFDRPSEELIIFEKHELDNGEYNMEISRFNFHKIKRIIQENNGWKEVLKNQSKLETI